MRFQQVMVMATVDATLRSEARGWSAECGSYAAYRLRANNALTGHEDVNQIAGFPGFENYATPIHALADGWKLLGPPTQAEDEYEWYFGREVDEHSRQV